MLDEWNLFQAARWAGVAPWELERQSAWWKNRILSVMAVEDGLAKAKVTQGA